MASKKDFKELCKRLEKAGYLVTRARNGHYRVEDPHTRRRVQICYSPSDYRSFQNTLCNLRKYLGYDDRAKKV